MRIGTIGTTGWRWGINSDSVALTDLNSSVTVLSLFPLGLC